MSTKQVLFLLPLVVFAVFLVDATNVKPKKVAVFGGGICGTTVAAFVKEIFQEAQQDATISLFEKSPRLGGRVREVVLPNGAKVEVGASVFHAINKYVAGFVRDANLTLSHPYSTARVGLWNGTQFAFEESRYSSINTNLAAIWRYGLSPVTTVSLVESAVSKLLSIYDRQQEGQSYETAENLLKDLGLYELTLTTSKEYLTKNGVNPLFQQEYVSALARLNYGQGLGLNGLAALVAMKGRGDSVFSAAEGNDKIIEHIAKVAGAEVFLRQGVNIEVSDQKMTSGKCEEGYPKIVGEGVNPEDYDALIVAYPRPGPHRLIPHQTHVTFVRGRVRRSYFNTTRRLPSIIISLGDTFFRSIGLAKGTQDIYKLFSDGSIEQASLGELFNEGYDLLEALDFPMAYPKLVPRSPSEKQHEFILHRGCPEKGLPPIFDAAALEYAVSTLETQAIAAKNTALLVVKTLGIQRQRQNEGKGEGEL